MDNKELIELLTDLDCGVEHDPGLRLAEKVKQAIQSLQSEPEIDSSELPGMWDRSDLIGGEADCANELEAHNTHPSPVQAEPVGFVCVDDYGRPYGALPHDCDLIAGASLYATPQPVQAQIPDNLVQRLKGRSRFLRDRGEIKTPELLERSAQFLESLSASEPPKGQIPEWLPIETAPKDGTVVQLLIRKDELPDCIDGEEDGEFSRTIGVNGFDNDTIDNWRVVGWSWTHDCFTDAANGVSPVAWQPLALLSASEPPNTIVQGEWVKCSERLPAEEDADSNGEIWESNGEEVWSSHIHFRNIEGIYWMPTGLVKPKPPTEG